MAQFAAEVFVALDGNDVNDGSQQHPFATLERARDELRALKGRGVTGPMAVTVMPGQYSVHQTLSLTTEDSGSERRPVVYRARRRERPYSTAVNDSPAFGQ